MGRGIATAAVIAAVAALPASALGAAGATTLALNGPAAKSLREAGVRIDPLQPAKGGETKIVLPIAAGLAGDETTLLRYRGGLVLRTPSGAKLRMTKLRLVLGKRSRLSAKLGGSEVDVFEVLRGQRKVDPSAGTVELDGLRLKLTRAGAKTIAARLAGGARVSHLGHQHESAVEVRPGRFGTLSARVSGLVAAGESTPGSEKQAKTSSGCPLPSGAGPAPQDPLPVATQPPGAVGIAAATVDWHVRESFIRYIATGEGTSVSGGASVDPPVLLPGASTPLSYDFHFHFPFASGWHDSGANPADPADDTATINFGGALRFLYSGHEIDLDVSSPEIEIAGAASRAIFTTSEGGKTGQRQVLVNLDLSRAAAIKASGSTYTYERVPGAVPSGTATTVFGGFYAPGTDFGCFTVTYTTS